MFGPSSRRANTPRVVTMEDIARNNLTELRTMVKERVDEGKPFAPESLRQILARGLTLTTEQTHSELQQLSKLEAFLSTNEIDLTEVVPSNHTTKYAALLTKAVDQCTPPVPSAQARIQGSIAVREVTQALQLDVLAFLELALAQKRERVRIIKHYIGVIDTAGKLDTLEQFLVTS